VLLVTVTINYVLLYVSYVKIKEMAERAHDVIVVRNGQRVKVPNSDIVPRDVIVIQEMQEIPCDCLLLTSEAYVNEASLTG